MKSFEDFSIMQGVIEFKTDSEQFVRAVDEGQTWGIYLLASDSYIRQGAVMRHSRDTPIDVWDRFECYNDIGGQFEVCFEF